MRSLNGSTSTIATRACVSRRMCCWLKRLMERLQTISIARIEARVHRIMRFLMVAQSPSTSRSLQEVMRQAKVNASDRLQWPLCSCRARWKAKRLREACAIRNHAQPLKCANSRDGSKARLRIARKRFIRRCVPRRCTRMQATRRDFSRPCTRTACERFTPRQHSRLLAWIVSRRIVLSQQHLRSRIR